MLRLCRLAAGLVAGAYLTVNPSSMHSSCCVPAPASSKVQLARSTSLARITASFARHPFPSRPPPSPDDPGKPPWLCGACLGPRSTTRLPRGSGLLPTGCSIGSSLVASPFFFWSVRDLLLRPAPLLELVSGLTTFQQEGLSPSGFNFIRLGLFGACLLLLFQGQPCASGGWRCSPASFFWPDRASHTPDCKPPRPLPRALGLPFGPRPWPCFKAFLSWGSASLSFREGYPSCAGRRLGFRGWRLPVPALCCSLSMTRNGCSMPMTGSRASRETSKASC